MHDGTDPEFQCVCIIHYPQKVHLCVLVILLIMLICFCVKPTQQQMTTQFYDNTVLAIHRYTAGYCCPIYAQYNMPNVAIIITSPSLPVTR